MMGSLLDIIECVERTPTESHEYVEAAALIRRMAEREQWSDAELSAELEEAALDPVKRLMLYRDYSAVDEFSAERGTTLSGKPEERNGSAPEWSSGYAEQADTHTAIECGRCRNLDMREGNNIRGRRQFQWACHKNHRVLRGGTAVEDVLLAPAECNDYDDRPLDGPGVLR
jgi:hypothetical protein